MEFDFTCPECGSTLEALDNQQLVDAMDHRIDELDAELPPTQDELN